MDLQEQQSMSHRMTKEDTTQEFISAMLTHVGVNLDDPNFKETPKRHAQWVHQYINKDVSDGAVKHLQKMFPTTNDEMIAEGPISVYMLCPHHLCPAIMKVSLVYIPRNKVLGLSKIARFLKELARFPMIQEDYTRFALDRFMKALEPVGAMVYVEGWHSCMIMRGVETVTSVKTSAISKLFKENPNAKQEALHYINNGGKFAF